MTRNQLNYSQAVQSNNTQTSNIVTQRPTQTQSTPVLDKSFYEKLKNLIVDVITVCNANESTAAKDKLINSAVRIHFGVDLTNEPNSTTKRTHEDSQKNERTNHIEKRKLEDDGVDSDTDTGVLSNEDFPALTSNTQDWQTNKTVGKKKKKKRKQTKQNEVPSKSNKIQKNL